MLRAVLCVLCMLPIVARAQATDDVAAREQFEAGRTAYDHGSFSEALAHFERAYALQPRPELLYNVGRAADSDGQAQRAIAAYEAYLENEPDAENADFVRARLLKMEVLASRDVRPVEPPVVAPPQPLARDEPRSHRRAWIWSSVAVVVAGGIVASVLLVTRARGPERAEADAYAFIPGGSR